MPGLTYKPCLDCRHRCRDIGRFSGARLQIGGSAVPFTALGGSLDQIGIISCKAHLHAIVRVIDSLDAIVHKAL